MLDGTITRATYDAADFSDPVVLEVVDKITVREDAELAAQMPSLANRVTVTMKDGRVLSAEHGTLKASWTGLKDEVIERKFREFAKGRMEEASIRSLLDLAWGFDGLDDMDGFMAATDHLSVAV